VAELPSTAFFAAQQVPDDDAVTGWFRDSRTSAAATPARPSAALAIAAVNPTAATTVAHVTRATPRLRHLIRSSKVRKGFHRFARMDRWLNALPDSPGRPRPPDPAVPAAARACFPSAAGTSAPATHASMSVKMFRHRFRATANAARPSDTSGELDVRAT
jgi:hypothetical protein